MIFNCAKQLWNKAMFGSCAAQGTLTSIMVWYLLSNIQTASLLKTLFCRCVPFFQEEMVKAGRNELKAERLALHRSSWNKYHKQSCLFESCHRKWSLFTVPAIFVILATCDLWCRPILTNLSPLSYIPCVVWMKRGLKWHLFARDKFVMADAQKLRACIWILRTNGGRRIYCCVFQFWHCTSTWVSNSPRGVTVNSDRVTPLME